MNENFEVSSQDLNLDQHGDHQASIMELFTLNLAINERNDNLLNIRISMTTIWSVRLWNFLYTGGTREIEVGLANDLRLFLSAPTLRRPSTYRLLVMQGHYLTDPRLAGREACSFLSVYQPIRRRYRNHRPAQCMFWRHASRPPL